MNRRQFGFLLLMLLVITVPYLAAYQAGGQDFVFGGFLLNPQDGNSYLAKMEEGRLGAWRFTLPYTAQPGEGAYLFLFYITLGHLAGWLTLSNVLVFHLARLAGAVMLWIALFRFLAEVFSGEPRRRSRAFLLAIAGSGLGWIAALAGGFTSDFWVAEAYPFLSMYANPHFPLGLAILIELLRGSLRPLTLRGATWQALLGLLLAVIQPFAVVVTAALLGIKSVWESIEAKKFSGWQGVIAAILPGGLFLVYQYWATLSDPVLSGWNAQNLTASPKVWDFLLSFSPAFLMGMVGLFALAKTHQLARYRLAVIWFIAGVVLAYLPFNLQRRFLLGFYLPCVLLAVIGVDFLSARFKLRFLWPLTVAVALPTNLIILAAGVFGVQSHDPLIYLTRAENQAMEWVAANTDQASIVLASPQCGMYLPARTGRRVLYGHPFETVNADEEKQQVIGFFEGNTAVGQAEAWLTERNVAYIFYGPRERALGEPPVLETSTAVYQSGDVTVYAFKK